MKKIAIISRALYMNGATKALIEMLRRIDYSDIEIDLWVLDFGNPATEWIDQIPSQVCIKKIPQYKPNTYNLKLISFNPIKLIKAIQAGKKLNIEEKMINQMELTAERLPMIRKKYDVAISFRHLDIDVFYTIDNIKADKKFFWVHGIQPIQEEEVEVLSPYYKKYDGVLPVSKSAENNIIKYFPFLRDKSKVAYCIVDSEEIIEKSNKGASFPEDANNRIKIFTIARLGYEKGIDIAVKTAFLLKEKNIQFIWYVAGEGNQRAILERMIENYSLQNDFILLGNCNNPYTMLRDCDLYVQPSRLESYGLAINEAKIMNKVIVCSDIPAGREQLENGFTGILSSLNEYDFADAIINIIDNNDLKESIIKNLSSHNWSHFEVIDIFKHLVNI
ncbi:glycosyltransferase [Catenibacterium mitsuokai]|uniref:glycosyltransferase n=1 Tax=Catenibacterium mitsuokai TaxID=100886 RepID=UPI003F8C67EE